MIVATILSIVFTSPNAFGNQFDDLMAACIPAFNSTAAPFTDAAIVAACNVGSSTSYKFALDAFKIGAYSTGGCGDLEVLAVAAAAAETKFNRLPAWASSAVSEWHKCQKTVGGGPVQILSTLPECANREFITLVMRSGASCGADFTLKQIADGYKVAYTGICVALGRPKASCDYLAAHSLAKAFKKKLSEVEK